MTKDIGECVGCGAGLRYRQVECSYCLRATNAAPVEPPQEFIEYTFLESDEVYRIPTRPVPPPSRIVRESLFGWGTAKSISACGYQPHPGPVNVKAPPRNP